MGLLNLGFGRIRELVNQCADSIIEGATLWGVIGFFLGLLIVLMIYLIPFLKPKSRFFKIINVFNFIYFPALFCLMLGGYGGISYAHKYVAKQIKETVVPMTKLSFPAFQIYLATSVDVKDTSISLNDAVNDFAGAISFKPKNDTWLEEKKTDMANSQVPKAIGWGIQAIVDAEIVDRGYSNVRRIEVANHMSFLKLKFSFWKDVELRTQTYANLYFAKQYMKLFFLSIGMGSLLVFQVMVLLFKPKDL